MIIVSLYRTFQSFIKLHTLEDGFATSRSGEGWGYSASYIPTVNGAFFVDERTPAQNQIQLTCEFEDRAGYATAVRFADDASTMLEYDCGTAGKFYRKVRFLKATPKTMKLGRIRATLVFDALSPYFQSETWATSEAVENPSHTFNAGGDLPGRLEVLVFPYTANNSVTIAAIGGVSDVLGSCTLTGPFASADVIKYSSVPGNSYILVGDTPATDYIDITNDNYFDVPPTANLMIRITSGQAEAMIVYYKFFKEIP